MAALKLAAAALVVLAGGALGATQGRRLQAQRMALQDTLLLLRLVQVRMENGHGLWLAELAEVTAAAGFQVLRFPAATPADTDLHQSLENYLAGAKALLGAPAADWLQSALECAVTRRETAARLAYYRQLLEDALAQACQKEQQDRRLYGRLGWLGGALIALILW